MTLTKQACINLLRKAADEVKLLTDKHYAYYGGGHEKWERNTRIAIKNIFNEHSEQYSEFASIITEIYQNGQTRGGMRTEFDMKADSLIGLLESFADELEHFWPDELAVHKAPEIDLPQVVPNVVTAQPLNSPSNNIFIIHGHDHSTKEEVARFLSKVGLNPIILHEQPNRGRAIIEKFESHADVSYAVALLTPDDVGAAKADAEKLQSRPRQNVLFEFGYFIGKLGRENVCGVVKGGVEIPSDYSGVIFIQIDNAGAWKWELLRELKAAQLPVDLNSAL